MPPFNAEFIPLPVTGYFLVLFECVCCCQCISWSLCILCAVVSVTVNKRQLCTELCTGSRALDTVGRPRVSATGTRSPVFESWLPGPDQQC